MQSLVARDTANLCRNLSAAVDNLRSMSELQQVHALVIALGLSQDDHFVSKILSFTAARSGSGDMDYSYRILSHLENPTIFNWNTIIRGYSHSRNPNKSLSVFVQMTRLGLSPDYLTYPFLVKASAHLSRKELGMSIHGHIAKTGNEVDRFVANSLIHMYASCGDIVGARKVFDGMPVKNSVSWNSMMDGYAKCRNMALAHELFDLMPEKDVVSWSSLIDGYVKGGKYADAMAVFEKMRTQGPKANEVTMVSVLCACAHLGALDKGRMMHQYMIDNFLQLNLVLRTSLVDMYAKCGTVDEALAVFRGLPVGLTDVLLWNAMIGGLAMHGKVKESLDLFAEMQTGGIKPDEITFLNMLSACAHAGLVKEAWGFFHCIRDRGMTPKTEHYACMIDVMARAGQVTEAYQFLCRMPVEPTGSMLGALLSGCTKHGRLDLAEMVGRKLVELEPDHDGRYVGLSNAYAAVRRWDEARGMREAMERRGVKKSPGHSFLEMSGSPHRFIAHDRSHPNTEQIYGMLCFIFSQMKPFDHHQTLEFCQMFEE